MDKTNTTSAFARGIPQINTQLSSLGSYAGHPDNQEQQATNQMIPLPTVSEANSFGHAISAPTPRRQWSDIGTTDAESTPPMHQPQQLNQKAVAAQTEGTWKTLARPRHRAQQKMSTQSQTTPDKPSRVEKDLPFPPIGARSTPSPPRNELSSRGWTPTLGTTFEEDREVSTNRSPSTVISPRLNSSFGRWTPASRPNYAESASSSACSSPPTVGSPRPGSSLGRWTPDSLPNYAESASSSACSSPPTVGSPRPGSSLGRWTPDSPNYAESASSSAFSSPTPAPPQRNLSFRTSNEKVSQWASSQFGGQSRSPTPPRPLLSSPDFMGQMPSGRPGARSAPPLRKRNSQSNLVEEPAAKRALHSRPTLASTPTASLATTSLPAFPPAAPASPALHLTNFADMQKADKSRQLLRASRTGLMNNINDLTGQANLSADDLTTIKISLEIIRKDVFTREEQDFFKDEFEETLLSINKTITITDFFFSAKSLRERIATPTYSFKAGTLAKIAIAKQLYFDRINAETDPNLLQLLQMPIQALEDVEKQMSDRISQNVRDVITTVMKNGPIDEISSKLLCLCFDAPESTEAALYRDALERYDAIDAFFLETDKGLKAGFTFGEYDYESVEFFRT